MAGAKPGVHVVQLKAISVPDTLINGNKFIKFDENSNQATAVDLKVDEKGYILYWKTQDKDMDCVDISMIRDTRTGSQCKVPKNTSLRDSLNIGQMDVPLEDKMLTIVYGADFCTLDYHHFVCAHKDQAKEWAEEILKYSTNLLALNSSSLTYLDKLFTRFNLVLSQDGKVSMKNIVKTLASAKEDKKKVEKALETVGFHAGKTDAINPQKFTFDNFFNFYRHLVGRTEVDKIFDELGAKKKPYLTTPQFCDFLNKQQRDPRLNEVLYPNYTPAQAEAFIYKYENKAGMAAKDVKEQRKLFGEKDGCHMSQEGFLKFLMSEDNNLIPPDKLDLSEDMDQPLAHYFINSSHNTYLTGHQFTGKSTVEMYHQVLLSGCRCIELDCWDGTNSAMEPVITHGYTMCTEILFKDVIEAIAQSAFKTSEYPVILSFENHCNPKQQAKMATYCKAIFGDMLLINPLDSNPLKQDVPLPSPNLLKRKIIIKNKKKHFHREKKPSGKNRERTSRKIRNKNVNSLTEGSAKPRLSEVEEDVELVTPVPASPTEPESPTDPPLVMEASPEPEAKSPTRILLEKNLSICSENTDNSDTASVNTSKDGDDLDSDSESSDSEIDEENSETAEDMARKKKEKKILTEEEKKRKKMMKKEKGTAGKEASAAMEMSLLVNYIQPVHFSTFENSERRKRSFEITSFVETQATTLLKESPVDFVNYNKRQMSRIYPRGTRVDSSNFLPQVFWNAGCQLVALNYQSLDLAMQMNLGLFEYNNRCGYIIKPDFMRRPDRKNFDPFAESTVDGIIAGTVSIKIISGQMLSEKKLNTYVETEMYGLPTDTVRKRFKTPVVPNNGLNPVYNAEPFVFKKVVLPNLALIRIAVFEEQGKTLIGHRVLKVEALRPGYRHIPLRNESNQPLLTPSLFVHITVKDYVPDHIAEYIEALANPIAYQSQLEKHNEQLLVLTEDFDVVDAEERDPSQVLKSSPSEATIKTFNESSGNRRQDSFTPSTGSRGAEVNMSPQPDSNPSSPPLLKSQTSYPSAVPHINVAKQESTNSSNSQNSTGSSAAGLNRMPSGHLLQGEGASQATRLSDMAILIPTPLEDMKAGKGWIKAIGKRDKELEKEKKKQEKARESLEKDHQVQIDKLINSHTKTRISMERQHSKVLKKLAKEGKPTEPKQDQLKGELQELLNVQDIKKRECEAAYNTRVMKLCQDHHKREMDVSGHHHGALYDALHKIMEQNHASHQSRLDEIHAQDAKDLMTRMDAENREKMKMLGKQHKDKQEFSRVKRENDKGHINAVVAERTKLSEVLEKRHKELTEKLDEVKSLFQKEKDDVLHSYKLDYEDNMQKLEEKFGSSGDDDDTTEDDTPDAMHKSAISETNSSNSLTNEDDEGENSKGSNDEERNLITNGNEQGVGTPAAVQHTSTILINGSTSSVTSKGNKENGGSSVVVDNVECDNDKSGGVDMNNGLKNGGDGGGEVSSGSPMEGSELGKVNSEEQLTTM